MKEINLIEKLKLGPAFLFLGQDYLKDDSNDNPLLISIKNHFFSQQEIKYNNYNLFFELKEKSNPESALTWIQNRCNKISSPDWLSKVANIPWSGVFTTSVDNIIERVFRSSWREVHPVYSSEYYPRDYKSKTRMHITYLFGNVTQEKLTFRPPLDDFEFVETRQNGINLLTRINQELITPFGILIIDGYDPKNDWIKPKDLYPIINSLNKQQTYIFGMDTYKNDDKYLNKLIKEKKLIPMKSTFANFYHSAELEGLIDDLEFQKQDISNTKRITINKKVISIPKERYNEISKNANVLDDTMLLPKEDLSELELKSEFRKFISESSIVPMWEGYKYNFNVTRKFETDLNSAIKDNLSTEYYSDPIIIHGQTGTGKTVSMGNSAYKFKIQKKYPVIFVSRTNERPSFNIIDDFCKWLEDQGANKTIIFWDDSAYNNEIEQYFELNNYLISRGRKVVVIGSAYKLDKDVIKKNIANFIEAPLKLNNIEINSFVSVFNKYSGSNKSLKELWSTEYDNNFLVAIYRLIPSSKYPIRKGVLSELEINEKTFGELINLESQVDLSPLAQALIDADIQIPNLNRDNEKVSIDIKRIIKLISVPGQYGLGVPLELVMRLYSNILNTDLATIMSKLDFFRVIENTNGYINIFPRHRLEAQIIANSKIANNERQINFIIEIINNIKYNSSSNEIELDFLVELLKAIGPNNYDLSFKYYKYYKHVSKELEKIRLNKGIYNHRTILQETSYLREYVKNTQIEDMHQKIQLLKKAENILKREIEYQENIGSKNKQIGHLLIELSSNVGAQLKIMINNNFNKNQVKTKYIELEKYLKKSQIHSADYYYPIDIWAWTTMDMLDFKLNHEEKLDLIAKVFCVFDKAEMENPGISRRQEFNNRLVELGDKTNHLQVSNDAFDKLINMGSASGIYLRARKKIENIDLNQPLDNENSKLCSETIEYLQQYSELVYRDEKTLQLLLKLKWIYFSGKPLFYAEKQTLPFSNEVWHGFIDIINNLEDLNDGNLTPQLNYLKAISLFHIGDIKECMSTFSEIRDNYYIGPRRIIISYIASTDDGMEKLFGGQLNRIDDNRAYFYITELRKTIPFFNRDFVSKEPSLNSTFDELTIGFNFLGLQVASTKRLSGRRN